MQRTVSDFRESAFYQQRKNTLFLPDQWKHDLDSNDKPNPREGQTTNTDGAQFAYFFMLYHNEDVISILPDVWLRDICGSNQMAIIQKLSTSFLQVKEECFTRNF